MAVPSNIHVHKSEVRLVLWGKGGSHCWVGWFSSMLLATVAPRVCGVRTCWRAQFPPAKGAPEICGWARQDAYIQICADGRQKGVGQRHTKLLEAGQNRRRRGRSPFSVHGMPLGGSGIFFLGGWNTERPLTEPPPHLDPCTLPLKGRGNSSDHFSFFLPVVVPAAVPTRCCFTQCSRTWQKREEERV